MKEETKEKFKFVILCPECNYNGFFTTINSLKANYPQCSYIAIVPENTTEKQLEEMSCFSEIYKGKGTITSLINTGLKNNPDWSIFMFEGAHIRRGIVKRLFAPIKNKNDVIFPIVPEYDRMGKPIRLHMTFPESTINGMTINQQTFNSVGEFTDNPLEISRMFWCLDAQNKGCKFTGIIGTRIS